MQRFKTRHLLLLVLVAANISCTQKENNLKLWYAEPAKEWMTEALPLGNSYIGAMFFGGISEEQIQFSEGSLWAGGPGSNPSYNFGIKKNAHENLDEIRNLLDQYKYDEANKLAEKVLIGEIDKKNNNYNSSFGDYGAQQTMGDLYIKVNHEGKATDYKRSLDIRNSIGQVEYKINESNYKRTYFANYPDRVMVYKFESTLPTSYEIRLSCPHVKESESFEGGFYSFIGKVEDNGMLFETKLKIDANGAKLRFEDGKLIVDETEQLVIVQTAATEYVNHFPDYEGADFEKINDQTFSQIKNKTYSELLEAHTLDYRELFSRVRLDLGDNSFDWKPTNVRLLEYAKGNDDLSFVSLYFQYSRYLMISGSRPGTLPMHLQGKWNNSMNPEWACDYHTNINMQMIYWPAEMTNLSECHTPMLDYIESLVEPGKLSAKEFFNTRGWIVNTMNNPFGYTSLGWGFPWGFYPGGAAWLCRHLWEHYEFTNDKIYSNLKNHLL